MSLQGRLRQFLLSGSGLLLAALCLLAFNLLAAELHLRLDLSAGRLYSLSAASKRALDSLEDPVEARAYFSKDLPPEYAAARAYTRDLLREYRRASGKRFSVRFVDVESETGRQEAFSHGLPSIQFNVISREKYEVREGYMGLVLRYRDRKEIVPALTQTQTLEYEITSRLLALSRERKPALAVLSSHGALGPERLHPELLDALKRNYELRPLDLKALPSGASVAAEISGLLVLGPGEKFSEPALYALDQFLLSGRPLVLALDAWRADLRSFMASSVDVGLAPWLAKRGVRVRKHLVLDAQCQKVSLSQQRGWFTISNVVDYPPALIVDDLDAEHSTTRRLASLTFPLASPLDLEPPPGLRARVLLRSSKQSWLRSAWARGALFSINPLQNLAPEPEDPKGPFPLGAELAGRFESAFSSAPSKASAQAHQPSGEGKLLILGSSRFANPDMAYSESQAIFLLSLFDWLALDPDLSSVRAKGTSFRPLRPIPDALKRAVRWGNILLPPAWVMTCGLARLKRRRRLREKRLKAYGTA